MRKNGKTENGKRKTVNPFFILFIFHFSFSIVLSGVFILLCALPAPAQKIAVLAPDKSLNSQNVRAALEAALSDKYQILDDSLAEAISQNLPDQSIFNLSTEDARNFGRAAGCGFFILVKSETLRRATLSKPDFYIESYAAVYLVSSRSGRLILWKLESFQSPGAAASEGKLAASIGNLASEISVKIQSAAESEANEEPAKPEELPEENSPDAKNFRPPLPYRRLKPEYTAAANLYNITATVDASVDLDEAGAVKKVEITRWAGYGLDESVAGAIRKMQWRAAERDGKTLPIRVLLRYNFKKIDHDE